MQEVLWLGDEACARTDQVGAKAAHLSRLANIHLVPPGFAVTAMESGSVLDAALEAAIRTAYRDLVLRTRNPLVPVAVRSSAIDEDGAGASFAGQHDTFLNVRGEDAVIDAIERCSRSASADVALEYRRQHGLSSERPLIAVLVQLLIDPVASAVVFSANPITGQRDEILITSAWGLGESVVGGTVTPDLFVLKRPGLGVVDRQIYAKDVMTVMAEGGTTEVEVPAHLRSAPSLIGSQVDAMGRLAVKLEDAMGWPVDIECAFAYDELYLLQCRPITTLS
ncbi:MAG: PEP/pyruvate-binding domain-containing protein [Dehalococcoidia bacterium]